MSKGNMNDLGQLHGKLTRYYNQRLDTILKPQEQTAEEEEEDFVMPLSPAELTAMNNFLKQNEVTADAAENTEVSEVKRKLQEMRQAGKDKLRAVN